MARNLPRVMLACMFGLVIALGLAVKGRQSGFTFATDSYAGTTFDRHHGI